MVDYKLLDIGNFLLDSLRIDAVGFRLVLVIGIYERVLTGYLSDGGQVSGNRPSLINMVIFGYWNILVDLLNNQFHEHVLNFCLGLILHILAVLIGQG